MEPYPTIFFPHVAICDHARDTYASNIVSPFSSTVVGLLDALYDPNPTLVIMLAGRKAKC